MTHPPLPLRSLGTHRQTVDTTTDDLVAQATLVTEAGYRLALVAGHDDGGDQPMRVVYLYSSPDQHIELRLPVDRTNPTVPSLAALSFPASRFERELQDLYGIRPDGHPQPRPLVRHRHWPGGWLPMRHAAGPPPRTDHHDEPFPFVTVEGAGVYEIPVGPVHAGLIEPGHFRFSVVGETIIRLKARLWYVHKGIEKLFQHRHPDDGLPLAERISGDTAVGHALAYCRAVEDALAIDVPESANHVRIMLLQLERLYNHITDIGALCNDVGHAILNAHAQRLKEALLRLNEQTTGHRLLRGGIHVGGATLRDLPSLSQLRHIATEIDDIAQLALSNSLVAERFTGTAILTLAQAAELGTLGYVARASGVSQPGAGSTINDPRPATIEHPNGDVMARFHQRLAELRGSFALLEELIPTLSPGSHHDRRGLVRPPQPRPLSGVGVAEGWRGTIVHRVELTPDHIITRNKIVDPSFFNWPALPIALANTIVPDFPLANKSFNLSYAGNDL